MDSNSVSPMPELAPIAEFDKSPPSPPNEEVPMDDLPPPPATITQAEGKKIQFGSQSQGASLSGNGIKLMPFNVALVYGTHEIATISTRLN
ncbi:unnamed protein product, partial [Brenthis ino]